MKMRFLPDKPISIKLEDILEVSDFVDILQNSICNTESPFVYGVLGGWGVGKTSILQLLQNRLGNDFQNGAEPFVPIWFNAWEYENEENIIYPLLHAIKNHYRNHLSTLDKTKGFWETFTEVSAASAMVLTDIGLRVISKQMVGESYELEDVAKQVKTFQEKSGRLTSLLGEWADQVDKLRQDFETLLVTYAKDMAILPGYTNFKEETIRFVIIIDDLDRCMPETTISVLESIKNFLMVKNCVFVLGLNPNVIYQGIRIKYKGLEIDGREYLEKILNFSFYVPEPEINKVANFVIEQFGKLIPDSLTYEKCKPLFHEFGKIVEDCHFVNPRKIKRVLNRYLFFISKFEDNLAQYHNPNLVRYILLAEYFPNIFQLFISDQQTLRAVQQELLKLGQADFEIKRFEDQFGVSISNIYPQLTRMKKLFDLDMDTTGGQLDPSEQALHVYQITRIV